MQDMTSGQIEQEDESGNGRDVAPTVALGQEDDRLYSIEWRGFDLLNSMLGYFGPLDDESEETSECQEG